MKKLLFILSASFMLFSCSKSDDNPIKDEDIIAENQIWGDWKLNAIYANQSTVNIATDCDLLYGKIDFSTPSTVQEDKGSLQGSTCSKQTFVYDEYFIASGQLKILSGPLEVSYGVRKQGNKLWLTKIYSKLNGGNSSFIPTQDQKTNYYILE
jgi:hypothetical protein